MRKSVKLAGAMVAVSAAYLATTGVAAADDQGGPVIYLNRHGGPTSCSMWVTVTNGSTGFNYSDKLNRYSCDGTMWLPKIDEGSRMHVKIQVSEPQEHTLTKDFTVKSIMSSDGIVDNDTAICFLAKANGGLTYTNMSVKGGECNGN